MGTVKGNNDVIFYVDGERIGEAQSITAEQTVEVQPIRQLDLNRAYSGTLQAEGVSPDLLDLVKQQLPTFDIEATVFYTSPPRKPKSKKRRIQKKWRKKYEASIKERNTYKNVEITGIEEWKARG